MQAPQVVSPYCCGIHIFSYYPLSVRTPRAFPAFQSGVAWTSVATSTVFWANPKPKTFNFTHLNEEKNKVNHIGFIAQDFERVILKEWEGIITTDKKGHKRLDYCKTAVIAHGALQHLMGEYEELKDLVKTMKKEMATMKGEITRIKKKNKDESD